MATTDDLLLADARQLIGMTRTELQLRAHVERTVAAVEKSRGLLARLATHSADDLFAPSRARAGEAESTIRVGRRLTDAQKRGLARKITAYLKRSGFDCSLADEPRLERLLN